MSYLSLVEEFHVAFRYRQPTPDAPSLGCRETNTLRASLMREELMELVAAVTEHDRLETLDALCDLQYVTSGSVLAWGLRSLFESHRQGCRSEFIHDESAHLAAMLGLVTQAESYANEGYPSFLLDALIKLQSKIDTCVIAFKFADVFSDAFAEVHRSNLSKIWDHNDMSNFDPENTNTRVSFEKTQRGYIARRSDGKIIKSPSYSPARLERFL